MKSIDKTNWSYLAALVDGEGTFSLYKRNQDTGKGTGNTYSMVGHRFSVYNTDERVMKWLISTFGGVYYSKSRRDVRHKIEFEWRTKGQKNLEIVILAMLPYLIIKSEQAKIMLEYIRLTLDGERINPERREQLRIKMAKLNRRGTSVETNTQDCPQSGQKIESELASDCESAPVVTQEPRIGYHPATDTSAVLPAGILC